MHMKKAVIFDLDGTLANTLTSLAYCTNRALEDFGLQAIPQECYKKIRRKRRAYADYAGVALCWGKRAALPRPGHDGFAAVPCLLDEVYDRYMEYFAKDCLYEVKPYPGIPELLDTLKEKKIKIAVFSNKPHANTVDVVETLFGKGFFDAVQGQKTNVPKKPAPDGVYAIMERLDVSPEETIYVGDSWVDIETGRAAGNFAVGVLWGFRDEEELRAHHADAVITAPGELMELL